ncbi:MAG: hypothetical protein Q9222_004347 [Ikaeria aurantiellina]
MIVGLVEIQPASYVRRSNGFVKTTSNGFAIAAGDIALAAAGIPMPLGGLTDIGLERENKSDCSTETSGDTGDVKKIIAIEYRIILRNSSGFGRKAVYRDSIPKIKGALMFGSEANDEELKDDDSASEEVEDLELQDDASLMVLEACSCGRRIVYHSKTGLFC